MQGQRHVPITSVCQLFFWKMTVFQPVYHSPFTKWDRVTSHTKKGKTTNKSCGDQKVQEGLKVGVSPELPPLARRGEARGNIHFFLKPLSSFCFFLTPPPLLSSPRPDPPTACMRRFQLGGFTEIWGHLTLIIWMFYPFSGRFFPPWLWK